MVCVAILCSLFPMKVEVPNESPTLAEIVAAPGCLRDGARSALPALSSRLFDDPEQADR